MLNEFMKIIFPPKCIFCGKILSIKSDIDICRECYENIPFIAEEDSGGGRRIFHSRYCDRVVCTCEYTGIIKEALIKFKFKNKPSFYRAFGKLLFYKLSETVEADSIDMVISVPLSRKRHVERGYNQAKLIAGALSRELKVPECSAVLKRVKNTQSQRLLTGKERHENVRDAFELVDSDIVEGKTIILVDDIYTTGSTVGECARILKEYGAEKVLAGVIASGRKY